MRNLNNVPYPWFMSAGALALGEAIGLFATPWSAAWPIFAMATVLMVLFGFGRAWRGWGVAAMGLLGLALALRFEAERKALFLKAELTHGPFIVDLNITSEPQFRGDWVSFRSESEGVEIEAILPIAEDGRPKFGECWRVAGWLERKDLSERRCRKLWVKGRGTFAAKIGELKSAWAYRLAARTRRLLSKSVADGLGERRPATTLLRAMLLGERSRLPRSEKEMFVAAGTMHVFAISGLHVGVVAVLIVVLLMAMFAPLRIAGVIMLPILWSYVFLIGSPPSAVRAALMASCYFFAPAMWQRSNGLVAWSQAFVIMHIVNPGALASVGSLLSFSVMLAILIYDRWATSIGLSGWTRALGLVFAIWAVGAPITAVIFGRMTPGGMLANLAVVPLAICAVVCGFLGAITNLLFPFLGEHFTNVAALITDAMRGISAAVASIPGSNFETVAWSWWQCALWYSILIAGAYALWHIRNYRRAFVQMRTHTGSFALSGNVERTNQPLPTR